MFLITTERLALRPVADADAEQTARLMTADVAGNLASWPHPMTMEEACARIRLSARMLEERKGMDFAIIDLQRSLVMGWIGLARSEPESATLGYWLGSEFQGRGFAREAVRAFVPEAGAILGVKHVWAYTAETNHRSIAVLEQNGFTRHGIDSLFVETRGREERLLRFCRSLVMAGGNLPIAADHA